MASLVRRFLRDRAGNFAMALAVALTPIMGGLALALDFAEMNRQKQATLNALDAAGIAAARHLVSGADGAAVQAYAHAFFEANLGPVDPGDTELHLALPNNEAGGGTLRLSAELTYRPYLLPVFSELLDPSSQADGEVTFNARTEIRLKNTLEVALVLDNSGSMDYLGTGSGQKRMTLLKAAAKQLADTMSLQSQHVRQVEKPVQFALVPFAGSVNIGPQNAGAPWMDTLGLSPVHHENFDWTTLDEPDRRAERIDGVWRKAGTGWGTQEGDVLTRFSLYRDMRKVESREWVSTGREFVCTEHRDNGTCKEGEWRNGYYENTIGPYASWQGCVEARPYPYNANAMAPIHNGAGDPATLFVPMFGPDEPGDRWATEDKPYPSGYGAANNWWNDFSDSGSGQARQRNMAKYYELRPYGAQSPQGAGPNYSCTTRPVTPLTDISTEAGLASIKSAIDAMQANGATNVPEGMVWGWHMLDGIEPFAEARPMSERGNDKVVIVLTDGENTYYTPGSLGYQDPAGNRSTYSAHGYVQPGYDGGTVGRLLDGTGAGVGKYDFSNSNYTRAMNDHFATLCGNAKSSGIIVMTIALDLDEDDYGQAAAIEALRQCASDSRFRSDAQDPSRPAKLFWNATGASLSKDFEEIADELSNLRIVS